MNDLEFSFELAPWERALSSLKPGDRFSAVRFLTLLEPEEEETVEDAFRMLEEQSAALDISDLPKASGSDATAVRLRFEEQLVRGGKLLTGLEEHDPLRLYLEELAAIPVCGDVSILAAELAEDNRRDAAQTMLANLLLSRVVELAQGYVGYGVLLTDLIQEGSMGLWQGILAWQGEGDFQTHADWWIHQAMAKAVTLQARANGVGQKMRQAAEDYRSVDERLLTELGRNPTIEEIAEGLHLSPEETAAVAKMMENARTLEKAKTPREEKQSEEEDQAVEDTAYFQSRQRIAELLSGLDETDAKLLTLRFGLEGGLPLSPADAGKKLGLTPDEVVSRETAALFRLRGSTN